VRGSPFRNLLDRDIVSLPDHKLDGCRTPEWVHLLTRYEGGGVFVSAPPLARP
jgi:hypothetical protein